MSQIANIPQQSNSLTSRNPLSTMEKRYVNQFDKPICGFKVVGCPSIVPLGSAQTAYGLVGPTSPKRRPIVIADLQPFNIQPIKDPYSNPANLILQGKQRYAMGVQNPNTVAVFAYKAKSAL
jgi:hypothetical protein